MSNVQKPITRHSLHTVKIDQTYSIKVQAGGVGDFVHITITAMGITVFQRAIRPDQAQAIASALNLSAGF